ncbi:c-type cytochrome [Chryseosolibacter indicus]|uniref:C-type cytochrome n=1 Tax=Chryseosolibacter indicus TaxID=2782351 RepID=A0ABS5VWW7_9BACT|nr:c-type cytochrome [Chryseosolibacter indicus]MBT1705909.1 c-type cytochrome [Chryseosolibacter indicus]
MLKRIFKIIGITIGVVVVIAIGIYVKAYLNTENRRNKIFEVSPQQLTIHADSAILEHGKRLVTTKGCNDCHGTDMGGKVFIDDPAIGLLIGTNLTKGKGGLPPDYNINDWVRALKHGLRRDGKPLLFMPSQEYTFLTEQDMGAIIAYCAQLPNVDREFPQHKLGPVGRILTDLDKFPLFPAEKIDHSRMLAKEIKPEVSIEFGKYLSVACEGCHKKTMKGGEAVAPGFPIVADISPTGNAARWTTDQFIQTLRTGITPENKHLKPQEMPWTMTKAYTDVELKALHLYLKSL